ncbi:MAG: hypothetical protein IJA97_06385 [Clostridia bacterium]|nr:hypothetical protein [Clostridia bacterium]
MENKTLMSVNADIVHFELVEKVSNKGITYRACDIVFADGARKQIGFALDFYLIRKLLKKEADK